MAKNKQGQIKDKKTGKYRTGRPTVMTESAIAKLEQAFAIDATVEEACSYADISRDSFYDYLKRNPKFSDRIADLRNRPVLSARQTLVKAVDKDPEMALKYLERKRKLEFSTKQEVEHSGIINMGTVLDEIEKENATRPKTTK